MTHPRPGTKRAKAIATVCLSGTLEDKLVAAAHAGFDGIELFEPDLLGSPLTPAGVRERCAELGLSIPLYQPFRDFEAVPAEIHARNMRRARHKFDVMEQLGTDLVLVCSSVSPHTVDDVDLAAAQLRELADAAAQRGLRIAFEALAWGRHVNTWQRSWEIVRRADHPALGLCLDSFHIFSRTKDVAGIADIPGEKIFFLQLSDAPEMDMNVLQWSRHYRVFPGEGEFDLAGLVGHVLAAGYTGPLSLEVFNDVFRQSAPVPTATDAMRSLLDLELRLDGDPDPVQVRGHAFTEIGTPPTAAEPVRAALASLGFTHSGRHHSKPVELWEQGDARVLVNTSNPAHSAAEGAAVTALGIEVADVGAVTRHAHELLAPQLARVVGPGEAPLSAVVSPDGTALFLSSGDHGTADWRNDFRPTGTMPSTAVGVRCTEYVELTQAYDRFDEATLFYRSVLGLTDAESAEYAGPFGLVRSRVLAADGFEVGLVAPVLRRGEWAPGVRHPQHIAFGVDDAVESARALRDSGAPVLEIPRNYYDDLDARLAPDPELLAALREYNVLYDRDEDGGELFQVFTKVVSARVFFELVQRRGGYRGHGTVNAPIRMAAHAAARR
ncbi:TIM barrel protein [Rhodococcus ruber]|uniref:sugar phosphate isomerase/epimerase and 4-hydroxyphenylpyruvate domain-containing protein n=1 Tax=Rhodococcus ruber TaxID=1830 RepID=UPI003782F703